MARTRRPHITHADPPPGPVTTTKVALGINDLTPRFRSLAREMADGDVTRIEVLGRGKFTVKDPAMIPDSAQR